MRFVQQISDLLNTARTAGDFRAQIQAFVQQAQQLAADGLTLAEIGQLFVALITLAVEGATALSNSGVEKKAFVLEAVSYLYDAIAPMFPLPWFLQPFRRMLKEPVRQIVLAIADGIVEAIYSSVKNAPAPQP